MNITEVEMGPHPGGMGERGVVQFPNGWGASVITGGIAYSEPGRPWEIAVVDSDQNLRYDSGLTDDVLGRLTDDEATKVLEDIEALTIKPPGSKPCEECSTPLVGKREDTTLCHKCLFASFETSVWGGRVAQRLLRLSRGLY